jgi:hypothetical protein
MPTNVSWFSSSVGTIQAEFISPNQLLVSGQLGMLTINDATDANRIVLYGVGPTTGLAIYAAVGNTVQINASVVGTVGIPQKMAVAYGSPWRYAINGANTSTANSAVPIPLTQMALGSSDTANATSRLNGYLRRVTYWNRALSDTEMQQVTT